MIDLSDWKPVISDEAFAYLAVQRGKESHLLGDRAAWEAAYRSNLIDLYRNIAPHLGGSRVTGVTALDVGSGMGGINALLRRHFDRNYWLRLLDGTDAAPHVNKHDEPFSCFATAKRFLVDNGFTAGRISDVNDGRSDNSVVTLVFSFAAWCFHFPPSEYLEFVKARLWKHATIILDVRKSRPDWRAEIEAAFGPGQCIFETAKFERLVFHVA